MDVHAEHVALSFYERWRHDAEVSLRFTFESAGRSHGGEARCVFHTAPSATAPPSLISLDISGRVTPSRFLISHHAVWTYFVGSPEPVAESSSDTPPQEEPVERKNHRDMQASLDIRAG